MNQKILIGLIFVSIVLVGGCSHLAQNGNNLEDRRTLAQINCISLCTSYDKDLSNGPCLSDNNPNWGISGWVCDIAHSPRQAVDNDLSNQCNDFRSKWAQHFVEVDPNCEFIRAV